MKPSALRGHKRNLVYLPSGLFLLGTFLLAQLKVVLHVSDQINLEVLLLFFFDLGNFLLALPWYLHFYQNK